MTIPLHGSYTTIIAVRTSHSHGYCRIGADAKILTMIVMRAIGLYAHNHGSVVHDVLALMGPI